MAKRTQAKVDPTPVVEAAPVAEIESTQTAEVAPTHAGVIGEAVAKAVAAQPVVRKGFQKFAEAGDGAANPYGITNSRGQIVTNGYLSRYIQCWCRQGDGFVKNRKENFAYFMSDAFLSQHVGKTASQIGKAASIDARWGLTPKPKKQDVNIATADPIAVNLPVESPIAVEISAA